MTEATTNTKASVWPGRRYAWDLTGSPRPGAPGIGSSTTLECRPYFGYQYWWDEDGHRVTPFEITAGYGDSLDPGEILAFHHDLDISVGRLTIELSLRVGDAVFESRREMFVSPDGVWVIRVSDSVEAPGPCCLGVQRREVWPGGFFGIVCPDYEPIAVSSPDTGVPGMLAVAQRKAACTAALALSADAGCVDATAARLSGNGSSRTTTFFVAASSSYEGVEAGEAAWRKTLAARDQGWDRLKQDTEAWWRAFYSASRVALPDEALMLWYARSLYYHGVYFGNTDIPPGCFSTNPAGFLGTVCPEFDLPFSQHALLYSNHLDEARRVAEWLGAILPKARANALGTTLHKTTVTYSVGALYGWLVGYDGTIMTPPHRGRRR